MHVAWWEGCTLKIFFEDRRGDDFQLWFSPCSPAMCGGRARKEHESATLQNAFAYFGTFERVAYFQNVPPFITGRKTPPISHPDEAAEKKLNNPKMLSGRPSPWICSGGSRNTKSPRGKHDAIQLMPFNSVQLRSLTSTTKPEQNPS